MAHGGVRKLFETEAGARISDPVEKDTGCTQAGNTNASLRVKSTASFHGIHQQFAERVCDSAAYVQR